MKVILIKDVAKVGQHGMIKEVSNGYALNFLIARGLAIQATPEKLAAYEAAQKREVEARDRESEALVKAIQGLEGSRVEIVARATEKGGLFKSVTATDIAKAILDQKRVDISQEMIALQKPIKETGEHSITIASGDAKAHFTISIIAMV